MEIDYYAFHHLAGKCFSISAEAMLQSIAVSVSNCGSTVTSLLL